MVKRDDCTGTNFYTGPTAGQSVDSANKVTFSWNNKCLSPAPEYIDLYLYAPSKNDSASMIQAFDSAKYAEGSIQVSQPFCPSLGNADVRNYVTLDDPEPELVGTGSKRQSLPPDCRAW